MENYPNLHISRQKSQITVQLSKTTFQKYAQPILFMYKFLANFTHCWDQLTNLFYYFGNIKIPMFMLRKRE